MKSVLQFSIHIAYKSQNNVKHRQLPIEHERYGSAVRDSPIRRWRMPQKIFSNRIAQTHT